MSKLIGRSADNRGYTAVDNGQVELLGARLRSGSGCPAGPLRRLPPYINQRAPKGCPDDFDGSASCGPSCMAMVARMIGYRRGLTDYQLIARFTIIGRTTMETGTEPSGIVAIARDLGRRATIHKGSDLELMRSSLRRGNIVIANGEYYAMPPHEDPSQREGHWILVYGIAPNGDFLVHDSEDPDVRTVTGRSMKRYLVEHDKGGVQVEIAV